MSLSKDHKTALVTQLDDLATKAEQAGGELEDQLSHYEAAYDDLTQEELETDTGADLLEVLSDVQDLLSQLEDQARRIRSLRTTLERS